MIWSSSEDCSLWFISIAVIVFSLELKDIVESLVVDFLSKLGLID